MSIQSRVNSADYSLFAKDYNKILPVSQVKPGGNIVYFVGVTMMCDK